MRNIEIAMLLQPRPSSFYYYALGMCHFAVAEYEGAIEAYLQGIGISPSFMPNHYALAIAYGVSGLSTAARSEAAVVRADWSNTSKNFFVRPVECDQYRRQKGRWLGCRLTPLRPGLQRLRECGSPSGRLAELFEQRPASSWHLSSLRATHAGFPY